MDEVDEVWYAGYAIMLIKRASSYDAVVYNRAGKVVGRSYHPIEGSREEVLDVVKDFLRRKYNAFDLSDLPM